MRIYFIDREIKPEDRKDDVFVVDAKYGHSYCNSGLDALDYLDKNYEKVTVVTNAIQALNNKYAWNEEGGYGYPDIYIEDWRGEFHRIDTLTNRELKQAHNLMKMYMAGEFIDIDRDEYYEALAEVFENGG